MKPGASLLPKQQDTLAEKGVLNRDRISRFLAILLLPIFLFPVAGRWNWWQGWAFLLLNIGMSLISRLLIALKNPDLILERVRFTDGKGTKSWDKTLVALIVYLPLSVMIVAALNLRFGWPPQLPLWLQLLGLLVMLLGLVINTWAMMTNRFFSSVVRIQLDRSQTVISTGPYQIVRHPGYAGGIIGNIGFPLLLGSIWALIPMGIVLGLIVLRTSLEDRALKAELPGYREYAHRVRYRLVPGIW